MPYSTRAELIALTREYMDAVGSARWSDTTISTVLTSVHDNEWSNILNAAPYYRFAQRTVTPDANGQIQFSSLDGGTGNTTQRMYRILSVTDGNVLYTETRFQDVPLATTSNYLPVYSKMFYVAGEMMQLLPVTTSGTIYVSVNYKPQSVSSLTSDSSVVDFPENNQLILVQSTASQLLLKGGAETSTAMSWKKMADDDRATMLDDIRRRTINPTRMAYPDLRYDWGGA